MTAITAPASIAPVQPPSIQPRPNWGRGLWDEVPTPRRRLSDWGTPDCQCLTCREWRNTTADRRAAPPSGAASVEGGK